MKLPLSASAQRREQALIGCILGTAAGDSLGLPCEGMSRRRQRKFDPEPTRQRLILGKGMCSDDTEHTCMVAQALLVSAGDPSLFVRSLAWRLRFWLPGMPAGVGYATLRAILKLWCGAQCDNSKTSRKRG